jgi:hypothetical protein
MEHFYKLKCKVSRKTAAIRESRTQPAETVNRVQLGSLATRIGAAAVALSVFAVDVQATIHETALLGGK